MKNVKTRKIVLVISLAAVLMLMFSACGATKATLDGLSELADSSTSDKSASSAIDEDLESQLIGNWSEIDIDNTYTFNADGTGEESYEGDVWDMTWTLDGNVLTMDFPDTGVEEYEIMIEGDKLTVDNPEAKYVYIRKK